MYADSTWETWVNNALLGVANGVATLDGSTLVVQKPADAQYTAAANKIPLADGTGKIDPNWLEPLDQLPAPTGALDLNNQVINNLAGPVLGSDAANKDYVDSVAQGLDPKDSVKVATTEHLSALSGTPTIDGVLLSADDRILVKNQKIAEVTEIDFTGETTTALDGKYITIASPTTDYYVWFDINDGSTDPTPGGLTGIEVNLASGDSPAVIASKTQVVLNGEADFGATVDTNTVTVTNAAPGEATTATEGTTTNLTVTTTTQGENSSPDNGIYVVAAGAWSRADDADTWDEHVSAFVFVEEGTTQADTGWLCTVDEGGTLDTTNITWVQFSQAGTITGANVGGGEIEIFRNKTGTTLNFKTFEEGVAYSTSAQSKSNILVTESADEIFLNLNTTGITAGVYGTASQTLVIGVDDYGRWTSVSPQNISITPYQVTNHQEYVEDLVSNLIQDSNSLDWTYTDNGASPGVLKAEVIFAGSTVAGDISSIVIDTGSTYTGLKLDGDVGAPGNYYVYSTDGSGDKGWQQFTSSLITDFDEAVQDVVGLNAGTTGFLRSADGTISYTYDDSGNTLDISVNESNVDHDLLDNFDSNEHIDHTAVTITGGTGLEIAGSDPHDIATSMTINMSDTAVTIGTYGSASEYVTFTVDQQGRLTAASEGNIQIAISQVTDLQDALDGKHIKHGFDDPSNWALSYDNGTRILTATPTGTQIIWINGVPLSTSSPLTTTAHADTTGSYFVTAYNNSGSPAIQVSTSVWDLLDTSETPVSYIYYNTDVDGVGTNDAIVLNELHNATRNLVTHSYLHNVIGTIKKTYTDFTLSGYTLDDGSADTSVTFAVASGTLLDEDINFAIAGVADNGPYTLLRREGATDWRWSTTGNVLPYFVDTDIIQFNEDSTGFTLSDVPNGEFVNYYVVGLTSVIANDRIMIMPGQSTYSTLADASNENLLSLVLDGLPFTEIAGLWKLTYERDDTGAASVTGNAILRNIEAISPFGTATVGGGSGGATIHNALSGRSDPDAHPTSAITDFNETVMDVVNGLLTDTDTIAWTYTDGSNTLEGDVQYQMSITADTSGLKLVNDEASPGNYHLYATNGSGTKGWYAPSELLYTRKYAQDVGSPPTKVFVITHNLGTTDVVVDVFDKASPYAKVEPDIEATSTNTVTLRFNSAPTANEFRVVIVG